jgi:hypothetical protein
MDSEQQQQKLDQVEVGPNGKSDQAQTGNYSEHDPSLARRAAPCPVGDAAVQHKSHSCRGCVSADTVKLSYCPAARA